MDEQRLWAYVRQVDGEYEYDSEEAVQELIEDHDAVRQMAELMLHLEYENQELRLKVEALNPDSYIGGLK